MQSRNLGKQQSGQHQLPRHQQGTSGKDVVDTEQNPGKSNRPCKSQAKLDEILKAVNPNARVTTYNCDGSHVRSTGPGMNAASEASITVGSDSTYQQLVQLYKSQHYLELVKLSLSEIESKPEWMTPRLFGSLAYLNLGEKTKAKEMLKEFDSKTGPAYSVGPCQQMADFLHSNLR